MGKVLEITTTVPCINKCKFCPQDYLKENYNFSNETKLKFEIFKNILAKLPKDVRIDFSGMSEPFANSEASSMMQLAYDNGYRIDLFTTLVGLRDSDMEKIKNISFGTISVHVPDSINFITDEDIWIEKFIKFSSCFPFFGCIYHVGELSDKIRMALGRYNVAKGEVTNKRIARNLVNTTKKCGPSGIPEHNVLFPNGDVYLCCFDYGLEHKIGNLIEDDYESLSKNKKEFYSICLECPINNE